MRIIIDFQLPTTFDHSKSIHTAYNPFKGMISRDANPDLNHKPGQYTLESSIKASKGLNKDHRFTSSNKVAQGSNTILQIFQK